MFETKFDKLKRRSTDIMSVFTKTVSDLVVVNDAIDVENALIEVKAGELLALEMIERNKIAELKIQQTANNKVISKITQFLEE